MQSHNSLSARTVIASEAVACRTFAGYTGATATPGDGALGSFRNDAKIGEAVAVEFLGTVIVIAGEAIENGALVEVGADGQAVTRTTGIAVGRVIGGGASAAGDRIEVFMINA
jgi:hypothetical protein